MSAIIVDAHDRLSPGLARTVASMFEERGDDPQSVEWLRKEADRIERKLLLTPPDQ